MTTAGVTTTTSGHNNNRLLLHGGETPHGVAPRVVVTSPQNSGNGEPPSGDAFLSGRTN